MRLDICQVNHDGAVLLLCLYFIMCIHLMLDFRQSVLSFWRSLSESDNVVIRNFMESDLCTCITFYEVV